jgi:beta-glucosidase
MGWEIHPEGLTDILGRLATDYPGVPLIITENGAAFPDIPSGDATVHDPRRVAFLDAHARAAHAALTRGVDLRGYLAWSLLDNFEWAEGYGKRFGLVYVVYRTQRRIVKDSGRWFSGVVAAGGVPATTHGRVHR